MQKMKNDSQGIPINDDDFESYEKGLSRFGVKILERNETSLLVDVTDLIQKINESGFTIKE